MAASVIDAAGYKDKSRSYANKSVVAVTVVDAGATIEKAQ